MAGTCLVLPRPYPTNLTSENPLNSQTSPKPTFTRTILHPYNSWVPSLGCPRTARTSFGHFLESWVRTRISPIGPHRAVSEDGVTVTSEGEIPQEQKNSVVGCKACGRQEIEKGCNGEGRIQGGIATIPGFTWWPIKAYRPCPGFVESGGRYRRRGQTLDEVAFGRKGKDD